MILFMAIVVPIVWIVEVVVLIETWIRTGNPLPSILVGLVITLALFMVEYSAIEYLMED